MATTIFVIILFFMLVVIVVALVNLTEIKRECEHDWELIIQKIYYMSYRKTYKCKKCGERKIIEEWCD